MMPARPQSARTVSRRSLGAMARLGAAASALGLGAGAAWGLPGGSPRFLLLTDADQVGGWGWPGGWGGR
jgi:hypothetical protein